MSGAWVAALGAAPAAALIGFIVGAVFGHKLRAAPQVHDVRLHVIIEGTTNEPPAS